MQLCNDALMQRSAGVLCRNRVGFAEGSSYFPEENSPRHLYCPGNALALLLVPLLILLLILNTACGRESDWTAWKQS